MNNMLDNFHLLRPEWLWALLPVILLTFLFAKGGFSAQQDNWAKHIDSHLLKYLSVPGSNKKISSRLPIYLFLTLSLLVLAISGPSWQQSKQPVWQGGEPIITVLSLAQSMNGSDVSPSRLRRASHKLRDMLEQTKGDEHGLVIYSDMPFIAAPLTSDPAVIEQMLPELSTSLMPVLGNRLDLAINEATGLLSRANAGRGAILVLADSSGQNPQASIEAAEAAKRSGYTVSVLAIGTEKGSPLQIASGEVITANDGQKIYSRVDLEKLKQLARAGGGNVAMLTANNADLDKLLPDTDISGATAAQEKEFQSDSWVDMGYWLLIVPTLLCVFIFRRGWLFVLLLTTNSMLYFPSKATATETAPSEVASVTQQPSSTLIGDGKWEQLWKTKDQAAEENFKQQQYSLAAEQFENPAWKAASLYKSEDYDQAIQGYSGLGQEYNLANSLARSGDLQASLDAYDRFLKAHPNDEDARFNHDLVEKLLKQQQKQQSGEQEEQQKQDQQSSEQGDQQKQDQQSGEQGEQQKQDQQSGEQGDQQKQDKQSGEQGDQQKQDQQSGEQGDQQKQDKQSGEKDAEKDKSSESDNNLLSELISEVLKGNKTEQPVQTNPSPEASQQDDLDQATEQILRRVPDDPSGLLRARIRQHYSRLRAAQN